MAFAHSLGIYHRDLRASNVLLSASWDAKVCDWGLSYHVGRRTGCQAQSPAHHAIGSLRWMAPEVLRLQGVSPKADVFSYAMLLFEMLAAHHPFPELSPKQAAQAAAEGSRPQLPDGPPVLLGIMQQAWAPLPEERPAFAEIVEMLVSSQSNS